MSHDYEILDRIRRVETKLTRFIAGEPDRPAKYKVEAWHTSDGWEVEVNSMSISLQAVIDAARAAGCKAGEEMVVCDNGKPRLAIREVWDMSRD